MIECKFQHISLAVADLDYDFAISPISVWALLAVAAGGSDNNTLKQLKSVLRLPDDMMYIPLVLEDIRDIFDMDAEKIESYRGHAIFSNQNHRMRDEFKNKLHDTYNLDYHLIDLDDTISSFNEINGYISNTTSGAIRYIVRYEDLDDKQMLMISANHFEGQWQVMQCLFYSLRDDIDHINII